MSRLINADAFLTYLIFSKYIDKATCGEIKNVIEHYTVDAIPRERIDKMIAEIEAKIIKNKCCEHDRWEKERNEARLDDLDIIHKYCDIKERKK